MKQLLSFSGALQVVITTILSGALSTYFFNSNPSPTWEWLASVMPGLLFGAAIIFGNYTLLRRNAPRIIAFLLLSVLAFLAAYLSAFIEAFGAIYGVTSGLIGALILTLSLPLIFRIPYSVAMITPVLVGTAGGALFMAVTKWSNGYLSFISWQVLVGLAIHWLVRVGNK